MKWKQGPNDWHVELNSPRLEIFTYEGKRVLPRWFRVTVKFLLKASEKRWTLTIHTSWLALAENEFKPDDADVEAEPYGAS